MKPSQELRKVSQEIIASYPAGYERARAWLSPQGKLERTSLGGAGMDDTHAYAASVCLQKYYPSEYATLARKHKLPPNVPVSQLWDESDRGEEEKDYQQYDESTNTAFSSKLLGCGEEAEEVLWNKGWIRVIEDHYEVARFTPHVKAAIERDLMNHNPTDFMIDVQNPRVTWSGTKEEFFENGIAGARRY